MSNSDLYTIPIAARPPHPTPLRNKLLFVPVFVGGLLGILGVQACFVPIGLLNILWRRLRCVTGAEVSDGGEDGWLGSVYEAGVKGTKQLFSMLLVILIMLFAPSSITLTTDHTLPLADLLHKPTPTSLTYLELPKDLVIMSNHQSYLDWMIIWMIGYLSVTPPSPSASVGSQQSASISQLEDGEESKLLPSGTTDNSREYHHGSRTIVILLKRSLKWLPVVGWGMQFYRFIFLRRSWAQDQQNLTTALSDLARRTRNGATGLWLLIFPEGTITSDNERAKSVRYAQKEGIPDFVNLLHPRSTGLHFILNTLAPRIPALKLLDITIGYPGVPRGGYAQEWYGLGSVFWKGVAPPTVHVHMRLVDLAEVRGLTLGAAPTTQRNGSAEGGEVAHDDVPPTDVSASSTPSPSVNANANQEFTLWLRSRWQDKEALLDRFTKTGGFARAPVSGDEGRETRADRADEVEKRGLVKGKEVVLSLGLW